VDLNDLRKLKIEETREESPSSDEHVKAIVRVSENGYVPPGVHVRSRIDGQMFTAELPADLVATIREDKRVVSVELNYPLQKID
jgi:hypothetical protein